MALGTMALVAGAPLPLRAEEVLELPPEFTGADGGADEDEDGYYQPPTGPRRYPV
jgi:hypothetical protein